MISIIIPTLNEEQNIEKLLPYLQKCCNGKAYEIIIADCDSTDGTKDIAENYDAILVATSCKGRAVQMNSGAAVAKYKILYFIHADTIPPETFYEDIVSAVENGYGIGRYITKFEGNNPLLKLNAYFTRFDWFECYGGDQTLFVCKWIFRTINGFNETMQIMEEYDLVKRARLYGRYKIFNKKAIISTRKYKSNSWLRVQRANYTIMQQYKKGVPQTELVKNYKKLLNNLK
jgi:rSAM/selenodomain-associated transferase 2